MHSTCDDAVDLRAVLATAPLADLRHQLRQVRPELSEDSLTFRAALLLLAGPAVRFNVDRLAWRTQVPRSMVSVCVRRLFDNGVWQPDGPVYAWQSAGDPRFWRDVGVAEGRLCRRTDPLGRIEWAEPGAWKKSYDFSEVKSFNVQYLAGEEQKKPRPEDVVLPFASVPEGNSDQAEEATRNLTNPTPEIMLVGMQNSGETWLGQAPVTELFPDASWLM